METQRNTQNSMCHGDNHQIRTSLLTPALVNTHCCHSNWPTKVWGWCHLGSEPTPCLPRFGDDPATWSHPNGSPSYSNQFAMSPTVDWPFSSTIMVCFTCTAVILLIAPVTVNQPPEMNFSPLQFDLKFRGNWPRLSSCFRAPPKWTRCENLCLKCVFQSAAVVYNFLKACGEQAGPVIC